MKPRTRQVIITALNRARQFPAVVLKGLRQVGVATVKGLRQAVVAGYKLAVSILKAGVSFGRFLWRNLVAGIKSKRVRLIVAATLFIGWLGYLGYAALTKNRGPVISHAQAAVATHPVVAEVEAGPDGAPSGKARVVEALGDKGPSAETEIFVTNLPAAQGFDGPGDYLLLLVPDTRGRFGRDDGPPAFAVVGQQRSPGNDLYGVGKPLVYRWTDGVRKQFEKLPK
jgi:hypothetical protein